jgi:hypothetical protein
MIATIRSGMRRLTHDGINHEIHEPSTPGNAIRYNTLNGSLLMRFLAENGDLELWNSALRVADGTPISLGTGNDSVIFHNPGTLAANTVRTDDRGNSVLLGTPVAEALPANSTVISNITASGDIAFYVNRGGNSEQTLRFDSSAQQTVFHNYNIVMNQQALDTNHFSLRSSDVATVLTTIVLGPDVTTSDYFTIGKASATLGGAFIQSLAETTATEALHIEAWGGSPATTDASSSLAAVNIFVGEHNGSNADADMASNSNALAVGEITSAGARATRFLLKADDGELHLGNSTLVALDAEDDIMAVRSLQRLSSEGRGILDSLYDPSNPFNDYAKLRAMGMVGERDDDGFSLFPLQPRLALHEGAMWQLFNDLMDVAQALPNSVKSRLSDRMQGRLALAGA